MQTIDFETVLSRLVRSEILALKPYSSARDEFDMGHADARFVFLDANENSLGGPLEGAWNRYPDPLQAPLKSAIAGLKGVAPSNIFLGNGSDEAIDLLVRAFCRPEADSVMILPPTYGMYAVQARIQGARVVEVPLQPDFTPDVPAILQQADATCKLLFLCSPNNPTGNRFPIETVKTLLQQFPGIVVLDEAYVDFSAELSGLSLLAGFPNLVVLQTFSKAWGLAALRIGMAFSNSFIISILNKIKYPYNLNAVTVQLVLEAVGRKDEVASKVATLLTERARLATALRALPQVETVFPSDANFLLVRVTNADFLYQELCVRGIVTRNRNRELHCANCLRITVGTPPENDLLIQILQSIGSI